jgi:hypothetical protein
MLTPMLLRRLSAPAAAFVLTIALSGTANATTWQRVQPPASGFSVLLPGTPEVSAEPINTQFGRSTMHTYVVTIGSEGFMASYTDSLVPLEPQRALDGARNGAIGKGRLISETRISLDGVPGRHFVIQNGGMQYTAKVYVDGRRIYQTVTVTQGQGPLSATAQNFLASFRFAR